MAQVINTNIASLNTQRNLNKSQNALNTSLQRLSSGLRINSAKDDAAGLAISERMTSQIRGLNQAARNANDGISLAQTAEGALGSIGENLQRIRELAVQSRNATNSDEDRAALDAEAQQLKDEIDRVAKSTNFNGINLLNGTFGNKSFQVGAGTSASDRIDVGASAMVNATSGQLGSFTQAKITGVAATAFTAITAGDLKISNAAGVAIDVGAVAADASAADRASGLAEAINAVADQTGVYASLDTNTTITLTSTHDITIALAGTADATTTGLTAATTTAGSSTGFTSLSLTTTAGADTAINAMDAALKSVNSARANLGAIQNRFTSTVSNLQTSTENLSASRSRVQDTDFAEETANLTKSQILQQAGTAMLAQAKSLPQQVLSLLQ